ncbi:transglycosylase domain-containing protein [Nocardioides marmotae]|uniref:Glycosyl transferase n=1 Tax=Nocardioides marmotae TaxID=2663857 RepID=A0A6I3JDD1_9ACTN|nr:transglycosylase domain-containing protein [Nocardioides marmotae]MCR6032453.1 glycosyl transferase [Gordonia jinghuaiqii]MBC9734232.1 penicillin-binding protein [Nocardioides marmotae]MTB85334.1 glycosyl transferase [Nocardioides marmotae]MTB96102.1 glycosyl transferase [Nocardioides marmotae]QKD99818.1 penicillin-binding protein [Nocardioides marmotae]
MTAQRPEQLTPRKVASHLGVMVAVAAVLGVVVAGLAIPFAGVVGIGAKNVADTMDQLPAELETEALAQRTQVLDENGETIATLYDQNRVNVKLTDVSRVMTKAIVAIEDYRFYQHGALDLKGTLRAFITNQANSGVVQGGSSITQQLVKLTLVDQAKTKKERREATDDSYARKLRELRYAVALEQRHTKDWILERYLNTAYFGDGAWGIQSAARHYFNVNASDLKLPQAALLAGLVKNPYGYDPTKFEDRAIARRNVVLERMAELGIVKQKRVDRLKKRGLGLDVQTTPNGCLNSRAPFFCDYLLNYLLKDRSLGRTAAERRDLIFSGGLTIRTTIDLQAQAAADEAVTSAVYPESEAIGGLAMVEPGTGKVRAIAQSRPMGSDRSRGQTYLNYVVNQKYGDSAGFQPGSTFKVFVLAAALEQGLPTSTGFNSPPRISIPEYEYEDCDGEPYGYGTWDLGNSTTSGYMDMYRGTRESVNTYFAQLETLTGICEPYELAKSMGVDLTNPEGEGPGLPERVPTFVLGIPDASPLELAEAYATFAARGLHCDSRPVVAIEDSRGTVLKEYDQQCEQVLQETTADAINDILRGVIEGGFASAQALGRDAAGKTGTSQSGQAIWFVGYTPNMAAASMIAGANESGTPKSLEGVNIGPTTIYGASGSGYAAPVWGSAMRGILDKLPVESFTPPSSVTRGTPSTPTDDDFGDDDE